MTMTDKWKEKYLQKLDEEDQRQQEYGKKIESLRRGLVRLSLVADGLDHQLDKQMNHLRVVLRSKDPDPQVINSTFETLDVELDRFEQVKESVLEDVQHGMEELSHPLLKLPLSNDIKRSLKKFRKKLVNESLVLSMIPELIGQFVQLQKAAVLSLGEKEESAGWLGRLFNRDGGSGHNKPIELEVQPGSATSTELDGVVDNILATLTDLFSRIHVPDDLQIQAQGIQQKLSASMEWAELDDLLVDFTEFILQILAEEQQDFEDYLQTLSDSLDVLSQSVDETRTQTESQLRRQKNYDQLMRQGLDSLGHDVSNSEELTDLKRTVAIQLDHIRQVMNKFQQESEQHEQQLMSEMEAMSIRLKAMEEANLNAQRDIEKQKQKAMTDPLTGLPNREAWEIKSAEESARSERYGNSLCIAVADVDYFKRINDTYGHLAGDKVLKIIASQLRKSIRESDYLARYGGEEFVILLPETNIQEAEIALNNVRKVVSECPFHFKGEPVQITMSFGIAEYGKQSSVNAVFSTADKALYQAKENGRNRVETAG
jgi:diguanylate cyclase